MKFRLMKLLTRYWKLSVLEFLSSHSKFLESTYPNENFRLVANSVKNIQTESSFSKNKFFFKKKPLNKVYMTKHLFSGKHNHSRRTEI